MFAVPQSMESVLSHWLNWQKQQYYKYHPRQAVQCILHICSSSTIRSSSVVFFTFFTSAASTKFVRLIFHRTRIICVTQTKIYLANFETYDFFFEGLTLLVHQAKGAIKILPGKLSTIYGLGLNRIFAHNCERLRWGGGCHPTMLVPCFAVVLPNWGDQWFFLQIE